MKKKALTIKNEKDLPVEFSNRELGNSISFSNDPHSFLLSPIPSQLFHLFYHATMSCHIRERMPNPNNFMSHERLYPLESPVFCCRRQVCWEWWNTCKSRSISSLWRAGQSPALSNGVYSFYVFRSSGATNHFME